MCVAVQCKACGKTTWSGCGEHVSDVLRKVPKRDRCTGHTGTDLLGTKLPL
jgi:hypothetical protein